MSAVSSITGNSTSSTGNSTVGSNNSLSANDFIQMMITELQNQDPLDPTSSDQLLSEMSQIGQLQASDSTQTAMGNMNLQTQIGSSAALIGKTISGLDNDSNNVTGVVNSVQVSNGNVTLALDNGSDVALTNITNIGGNATSATSAGATTSATTSGTSAPIGAASSNGSTTPNTIDGSSQYDDGSSTYSGM